MMGIILSVTRRTRQNVTTTTESHHTFVLVSSATTHLCVDVPGSHLAKYRKES